LKIDWDKTTKRMREAGFTQEELEQIKKDTAAGVVKFLDKERKLSLSFRHKGLILELEDDKTLDVILKQLGGE